MKKSIYLIIILIPCLMSLSFSVNYTVQFKSGEIVQGELVKQDDIGRLLIGNELFGREGRA